MSRLRRLVAISTLMVSLSALALAGETLTPPVAPPPPAEFTTECSETEASTPVQSSSVDIVTEATMMLAGWLEAAIF